MFKGNLPNRRKVSPDGNLDLHKIMTIKNKKCVLKYKIHVFSNFSSLYKAKNNELLGFLVKMA